MRSMTTPWFCLARCARAPSSPRRAQGPSRLRAKRAPRAAARRPAKLSIRRTSYDIARAEHGEHGLALTAPSTAGPAKSRGHESVRGEGGGGGGGGGGGEGEGGGGGGGERERGSGGE